MDKYQPEPLKTHPDGPGACQDDAIGIETVEKTGMAALVLAQRIESGRPQVAAQFSQ